MFMYVMRNTLAGGRLVMCMCVRVCSGALTLPVWCTVNSSKQCLQRKSLSVYWRAHPFLTVYTVIDPVRTGQ